MNFDDVFVVAYQCAFLLASISGGLMRRLTDAEIAEVGAARA
jgi:hypothetical protein